MEAVGAFRGPNRASAILDDRIRWSARTKAPGHTRATKTYRIVFHGSLKLNARPTLST